MAKLLIQDSDGAREFELVDLEMNIGRELDNTLRLADPSVSRHHAVIRKVAGGYEITDLQSSNGVLLNGVRVPAAPLRDGDRITLGQMQLTFLSPGPAPEPSPAGTVHMDAADMDRFRASTSPDLQATGAIRPRAGAALPGPEPRPRPTAPGGFLQGLGEPYLPLRHPDGTVLRGGFQARFLAALIDFSPLIAVNLLAAVVAWTAGGAYLLASLVGLLQLALLVAYLILLPFCWMRFGATPGKRIMKLRVVPEDDPDGRLDLAGALTRLFGFLVNAVISWILMFPVVAALVPATVRNGGMSLPIALLVKGVSLAAALVPYLLVLGSTRRQLADHFAHSLVIQVDR